MSNPIEQSTWIKHGKAIALALGFFTRLPTCQLKSIADEDMGRALLYFPLVGLAVGLVTALTGFTLVNALSFWHGSVSNIQLAVIGFVTFTMLSLLSGGLHLDGVADCADAWVGGLGDKERTLEIMKDPTCGPMAVFVLVLLLLLKAAAVVALVFSSQWLLLVLLPVLSRTAGMALFLSTDYVRPKGLGQAFADFSGRFECRIALLIGLLLPLIASDFSLWLPVLITAIFWWWLRAQSIERIGGFTGDVTGSVIELSEACLLVSTALLV